MVTSAHQNPQNPQQVATVCVRSQHAKYGRSGFHGPDTYVALVIHDGSFDHRTPLHEKRLTRKGYELIYCGEGYGQHTGPRSKLGQALKYARTIANDRGLALVAPSPPQIEERTITPEQIYVEAGVARDDWAEYNRKMNAVIYGREVK